MNILILGGTVFVGRGVAEAAMARGHQVTLFHRGSKGTGIVPGAEEVLGDRDGGLDALAGKQWDAVVDACGYVPRIVGDSSKALRDSVSRYLFVSTISVYEETEDGGLRELPVGTPVGTEEITGETYGPLKVECERVVRADWGDRGTIVRPGLVYGPYDPTNRFPYWVGHFLEGGDILVPDAADYDLQQIDARDLGEFIVTLLENDRSGIYDAVGEDSTFGTMIAACQTLNPDARQVLVAPEKIEAFGIRLGWELPLAYGHKPTMRVIPQAAVAAGLKRRPLAETLADTAAWVREVGLPQKYNFGLSREREAEALAALREG